MESAGGKAWLLNERVSDEQLSFVSVSSRVLMMLIPILMMMMMAFLRLL